MNNDLLLVIPSNIADVDGQPRIDEDFLNNLIAYARNFDRVVFACVRLAAAHNPGHIVRTAPLSALPANVTWLELPYAYREDRYLLNLAKVRRELLPLVRDTRYLLLAPHAPFDWASLATEEAIRLGKPYDIECDLDLPNLHKFQLATMRDGPLKWRKRWWVRSFERAHARYLHRSSAALIQGQEVFDAYAGSAPNAQLVLNVQIAAEDHLGADQLARNLARVESGAPVRIVYGGNASPRKGPLEWVGAIAAAIEEGADIEATWAGAGELLPAMKQAVAERGLGDRVRFAGMLPRPALLEVMRDSDLVLFCHKTAESPRTLVDALGSGCALVGYDSAYPRSLVAPAGGGAFVPLGDWAALGRLLVELDADRSRLSALIAAAARTGDRLDRDASMQHRIDLIRQFC